MRILPLSTIDDNRTILQLLKRIEKYLCENPIRNIFGIEEDYEEGVVAYDVSKILINSELDVTASADDILMFQNGYIGIIDGIGAEYVTVQSVQPFKGDKGDQGDQGVGIREIRKTGSSSVYDYYTIFFTNGTTFDYSVTNGRNGTDGKGIRSIDKSGTVGLVDTYVIYYTDNTQSTFTVTNGANGRGISSIAKTSTEGLVDTYTVTLSDGSTTTFTVTNGRGISTIQLLQKVGKQNIYEINFTDGTTTTFSVWDGADGQGVPTGGTAGQVLEKVDGTDFNARWADKQAVPTGGTEGQVLTKTGSGNTDYTWANPTGGGGASIQVIGENLLINPDFKIDQRGETSASEQTATEGKYTRDRWYVENGTVYKNPTSTSSAELFYIKSGTLHQFVEISDDRFSKFRLGKYLIAGITIVSDEDDHADVSPSIQLRVKRAPLAIEETLTPINSSLITVETSGDVNFARKQYVNIYEIPNYISYVHYFDFRVTKTGTSNMEFAGGGAFLYSANGNITTSQEANTALTGMVFPIHTNTFIELEKCKFYFNKVTTNSPWVPFLSDVVSGTNYYTLKIFEQKQRVVPTKTGSITVRYVDSNYISQSLTISATSISVITNSASKYIVISTQLSNTMIKDSLHLSSTALALDAEFYPS